MKPGIEVPENAVNCVLTMFGKCSYNKTGCSDCEIKEKIRKALENEPKKGEWIKVNPEIRGYTDFFRCSTCLAIIQLGRLTKACDYIFCPYCSADMREV